jgi:hypothetical protein
MRARDTSYDTNIVIADRAFGWYKAEDVKTAEPTEAGGVLMLFTVISSDRNSSDGKQTLNLHS